MQVCERYAAAEACVCVVDAMVVDEMVVLPTEAATVALVFATNS